MPIVATFIFFSALQVVLKVVSFLQIFKRLSVLPKRLPGHLGRGVGVTWLVFLYLTSMYDRVQSLLCVGHLELCPGSGVSLVLGVMPVRF